MRASAPVILVAACVAAAAARPTCNNCDGPGSCATCPSGDNLCDWDCADHGSTSYKECTDNLSKYDKCDLSLVTWPAGWGESGGAADIESILANPAVAWAVNCVCDSECTHYQEFQNWPARTTGTGACAVAASVTNTLQCPAGTSRTTANDRRVWPTQQGDTRTCGEADTHYRSYCSEGNPSCATHLKGMCCDAPLPCPSGTSRTTENGRRVWPTPQGDTRTCGEADLYYNDYCGEANPDCFAYLKGMCCDVPLACPSGTSRTTDNDRRAWPDVQGDTRTCGDEADTYYPFNDYCGEANPSCSAHLNDRCCDTPLPCPSGTSRTTDNDRRAWPTLQGDTRTCGEADLYYNDYCGEANPGCSAHLKDRCCDSTSGNSDRDNWIWGSAENICAGIIEPCYDGPSCTRLAIGPCRGEQTTKPDSFVSTELTSAAVVNIDKYLQCTDPSNCDDMYPIKFTGIGYRDQNQRTIPETNYSEKTTSSGPLYYVKHNNLLTSLCFSPSSSPSSFSPQYARTHPTRIRLCDDW